MITEFFKILKDSVVERPMSDLNCTTTVIADAITRNKIFFHILVP